MDDLDLAQVRSIAITFHRLRCQALMDKIIVQENKRAVYKRELDGYRAINPEYINRRLTASMAGCTHKTNRMIKELERLND